MIVVAVDVFGFNISIGIFPYTNYSFTVQACNMIGCSEFGMPSQEIRTDQDGEWVLGKCRSMVVLASCPTSMRVIVRKDIQGGPAKFCR